LPAALCRGEELRPRRSPASRSSCGLAGWWAASASACAACGGRGWHR